MKKILSLVLATLMIVGCVAAFSACNDDEGDKAALKVVDIGLTEEEYAFAVAKGNAELLGQLNTFLAKIKGDGTFNSIVNKYYGDGTPTAVKSAATMKNDGTQLIVATNAAFEPFEYKNGENYYGIDMEIMDLFAKEIGKELYIYDMTFDAVCLAVSTTGGDYTEGDETIQSGICDIAAAGLTVREDRAQILDFSDSYYNAAQMLIVAADDTTFDECKTVADVEAILNAMDSTTKVGTQNGTTGKVYCEGDADVEGGFGFAGYKFTTIGYDNGALAAQNILNGNVKYVIIDEGPAKAIVENINAVN